MKKLFYVAALSLLMVSCGESKEKKTEGAEVQKTQEVVKDTAPTEVKLELSSDDAMKYDKSEFRVKEGQQVTLVLTHKGTMAKNIMGHNFVLLKPGTVIQDFAMKAMEAAENNYIPEGDEVIAHTDMIGGGESASVTFQAPAKGTYDFICSFPGHYGMMKGKFIVE